MVVLLIHNVLNLAQAHIGNMVLRSVLWVLYSEASGLYACG